MAAQELDFAQRSLQLKEEALKEAERSLHLIGRRGDDGSAGQAQLADARKEVRTEKGAALQAEAAIHTAEMQLELARDDLDRHSVRAPLDGRVIEVNCHPGEYVSPTSPVVIIELSEQN